MRKKKITFSSSGGGLAMRFMSSLMNEFGNCDIERVASQIAAACSNTPVAVTATLYGGYTELKGNTATCLKIERDTLSIVADNAGFENGTLTIDKLI